MPRVSVLTPTYNHAAFIRECVESVVNQTFGDWEMIVVDDGSTDGTADIVAGLPDPRVRLLRQANKGINRLAETYNGALDMATGSVVAILEGDDLWPPDKLARQVAAFEDAEVVLASGRTRVVGPDGSERGTVPDILPSSEALTNTPVGRGTLGLLDVRHLTFTFPVSTLLRRSALDRVGGFLQPTYLPVVDLPTFVAVSQLGRFSWSEEVCGVWRRHEASTTSSRLPLILDGVYRFVGEWLKGPASELSLPQDDLKNLAEDWSAHMVHRAVLLSIQQTARGDRALALQAARLATRFPGPPRRKAKAWASWLSARLGLPEGVARRMTATTMAEDRVNDFDHILDPGMVERVTPWEY